MDENQVRTVGLIGGGAALIVALGMALLGREPAGRPADVQPAIETPASVAVATPSVSATAPIPRAKTPADTPAEPRVETSSAEGPPPMAVVRPEAPKAATPPQNPGLEFIVRFDNRHPMSRAQDLWLQGKHADAATLAQATLAQRSELRGLCFSRFTLGAEVVLTHCAAIPRAQVARTSERWLKKLRATRGVQYADANVVVDPERR